MKKQPSSNIAGLVTHELRQLGIGASHEFQDVIQIDITGKRTLVCGMVNEYWGCDLHNDVEKGDLADSFTLSVRSDDERRPKLIAKEIQALVKRLNGMPEALVGLVLSKPVALKGNAQWFECDLQNEHNIVCVVRAAGEAETLTRAQFILEAINNNNAVSEKSERLLETVADIAHMAGAYRYYSGDSRADIAQYIAWARDFEASGYAPEDYMTAIETFTLARLSDAGYTKSNSPMQLVMDFAEHMREGRAETVTAHKIAMLDGGIAAELIERAERMLR